MASWQLALITTRPVPDCEHSGRNLSGEKDLFLSRKVRSDKGKHPSSRGLLRPSYRLPSDPSPSRTVYFRKCNNNLSSSWMESLCRCTHRKNFFRNSTDSPVSPSHLPGWQIDNLVELYTLLLELNLLRKETLVISASSSATLGTVVSTICSVVPWLESVKELLQHLRHGIFDVLLNERLLNPVLIEIREHHLRHFSQLLHHLRNIEKLLHGALQHSALT